MELELQVVSHANRWIAQAFPSASESAVTSLLPNSHAGIEIFENLQ
jgi:hypothetical protein